MKLSFNSISKLALMICGQELYAGVFPYRSSTYLTQFFREIDLQYTHHGETRRWWVQDILIEINNLEESELGYLPDPDLVKIIIHLLDRSEFNDPSVRQSAITHMNELLIDEGLQVSIDTSTQKAKVNVVDGERGVYDVALSFAGEDRDYIKKVAHILKESEISVFYDKFEEVELWGKDLAVHLNLIYGKKSKTVVIFISQHYYQKIYPRHEFKSALATAIASEREYILPAKFDDTIIPGIPDTVKYLDLRNYTPEQFASMIIEKLRKLSS